MCQTQGRWSPEPLPLAWSRASSPEVGRRQEASVLEAPSRAADIPRKTRRDGPGTCPAHGTRPAHGRPRSGHQSAPIALHPTGHRFPALRWLLASQPKGVALPATGSTRQLTVEHLRFLPSQQPTLVGDMGKVRHGGRVPRAGRNWGQGPQLPGKAAEAGAPVLPRSQQGPRGTGRLGPRPS